MGEVGAVELQEVVPMTRREARRCCEAINGHLANARVMIFDLYERRGWEALGYASWRDCVVAEFEGSQGHLYRQLQAARIERDISPMGEIGKLPERVLRPLRRMEPEPRRVAWRKAVEAAPEGKPTAKLVEAAVREVEGKPPHPDAWTFDDAVDNLLNSVRTCYWKCPPESRKVIPHILESMRQEILESGHLRQPDRVKSLDWDAAIIAYPGLVALDLLKYLTREDFEEMVRDARELYDVRAAGGDAALLRWAKGERKDQAGEAGEAGPADEGS